MGDFSKLPSSGVKENVRRMIDADANATTPPLPEVLEAMLPWLGTHHANPSGSYSSAKRARAAIDHAREQVAAWIGAQADEIVFTGGGTESVNTALRSLDVLCGHGAAVVSAIEHSAVLRCVESLPRETRRVPVNGMGRVIMEEFEAALEGAAFVSVMMANNETGVIQPLGDVVKLASARGLPVHTDAIQAAGKMPLDVKSAGVDMLSLSAHKFHGPTGVGALYVRSGLKFEPLLHGGGQEGGRRSGTENIAGIVGMGKAAELAAHCMPEDLARVRDAFEQTVLTKITGIRINGDLDQRLANTCHLSIEGCDSAGLLILLDEADVACSAGSACMTGKQKPSHVQLAMGIPAEIAKSSLRFSFSRLNTREEAVSAAVLLSQAVDKLRRVQNPGVGPVSVYSP